ncbi:4-hydroxybenzoate octaprenyltransferase [Paralimibaculum aggregatum]|uniref:4-hydroxybenzoate octaprenyltransferase n=1 Tax=Paralimibaculum aggregatum TaxID=3036245 RepID=A0ABQ6LQ90_9RHOB|nr:4-hydroxybenzoate octaprenyltransferase [Limibaculum sp. NKW23]GMG84695.1 4-hydroxybenzoate octaprenyltransferase [Limibaculum sp. NKW23]
MEELPINRVALPEGRVKDATARNWVDAFAPERWRPFMRLSRMDRPIGTWLLLLPCWWGILLAANAEGWAWVDLWLFPACTIGALLMRGAGCTWNDLVDRDIDAKVDRTRSRPLPSGQVSAANAVLWAVAQSLVSFLILLTFNDLAVALGVLALVPVAVYPFAKRFTWWPQVFLGIAFNWGALLLYAAHGGSLGLAAILAYLAGIAWTLHYDTIYAHQDREDDALIGVKSTARLFEDDTVTWLQIFSAAVALLGALAVLVAGGGLFGLLGLAGLVGQMVSQLRRLDTEDPELCLQLFRQTRYGGLAFAAGLFLDALF